MERFGSFRSERAWVSSARILVVPSMTVEKDGVMHGWVWCGLIVIMVMMNNVKLRISKHGIEED